MHLGYPFRGLVSEIFGAYMGFVGGHILLGVPGWYKRCLGPIWGLLKGGIGLSYHGGEIQ